MKVQAILTVQTLILNEKMIKVEVFNRETNKRSIFLLDLTESTDVKNQENDVNQSVIDENLDCELKDDSPLKKGEQDDGNKDSAGKGEN